MANYFNTLPLRLQLEQLGVCEFMEQSEFADGIACISWKKSRYRWLRCSGFESGFKHERFRS
jgi:hypothetical protein